MAADAVKLLFFSSSLPFSFILSRLVHPSVLWWEGEAVAAAAWQAGQVAAAGRARWMDGSCVLTAPTFFLHWGVGRAMAMCLALFPRWGCFVRKLRARERALPPQAPVPSLPLVLYGLQD